MRRIGFIFVLFIALGLAILVALATPIAGLPAAIVPSSRYCALAAKAVPRLPERIDKVGPAQAARLAKQLAAVSAAAPTEVGVPLRTVLVGLRGVAGAPTAATRSVIASHQAPAYAAARVALTTLQSKYCRGALPATPSLGTTQSASDAACTSDGRTIRMAEDLYNDVNGAYVSMPDLVSAGFLRNVSTYYSDIILDRPPGGYTIVAVAGGPCGDIPVTP
ncbi:MAG TPA: hypothetical protein VH986_06595 [Acidimicrobiia bacterium]